MLREFWFEWSHFLPQLSRRQAVVIMVGTHHKQNLPGQGLRYYSGGRFTLDFPQVFVGNADAAIRFFGAKPLVYY
jgi:hypothetical protein